MVISRNGVCYDLSLSEYRHTTGGLTYVFSSQLHLEKFKKKLCENRDLINYSLTKRFNISVNVAQLADIVLYRKIETRGFLIVTHEGKEIWEKRHLKYAGGKAIAQNSNV